jgi:hypothetical protein
MMATMFDNFLNKQIYVQIETNTGIRRYSGILTEVQYLGKNIDNSDNYFLFIIDKFNTKVGFSSSSIKFIEEEK